MSDRRRVVVFGDVIDDIVVIPEGEVRPDTDTRSLIQNTPGGSAANVASWCARAGGDVDFVGSVGAADVVRHTAALEAHGVRAHLVGDPHAATGTIVVIVNGGFRNFLTQRGANSFAHPDSVTDDLLDGAAVLHLTGFTVVDSADAGAFRRLIERAVSLGVEVSMDPGSVGFITDFGVTRFSEAIAAASLVFPSLEEGRALTGEHSPPAVATALGKRFRTVALTLGADGALVTRPLRRPALVPAILSRSVDPTGAGDAFCAGFLADWVVSRNAMTAARAGVALASEAVRVIGGRPPI